MILIGVLSDTHINDGGKRRLPPRLFDDFAGVDLIIHAGDLNSLQVVADLEAIAPVLVVHGNNETYEVMSQLDGAKTIELEDCTIGLTHGHVPAAGPYPRVLYPGNSQTAAYALSHFPAADCVIFGHSHLPLVAWHEVENRRILLLNPGSATDCRKALLHSCALLRVDGASLEAELLEW